MDRRLASCSDEAGAPPKRSARDDVVELRAALSEARGVKLYLSTQLAAAEGQLVATDEQLVLRCAELGALRAANDGQTVALEKMVREWEARASTFAARLAQKDAALEELQATMAKQLAAAEEVRRRAAADGGTWRAALTKQLALRDAERASAVAERDAARTSAESLTLALRAAEIAARGSAEAEQSAGGALAAAEQRAKAAEARLKVARAKITVMESRQNKQVTATDAKARAADSRAAESVDASTVSVLYVPLHFTRILLTI